jgi:hypothetical protein
MPTEGSGGPAPAKLIMKIDPPDALKPGIHCVRTLNQARSLSGGFITFQPGIRSHGSTPETLHAQVIRLAVSDIVIFMGQCGR